MTCYICYICCIPAWDFSGYFAGEGWVHKFSLHTHILVHIMGGALHPGLRNLRIRRDCVAMSMRMYFPFWLLREPQLESVFFTCMLTQVGYQLLWVMQRGEP